jgi:transposase
MSRAYSEDLRERVIKCYENGVSKWSIVIIFNIGIDTLNRWIKKYNETGGFAPKTRTKYRQRKFSDSDLLNYIKTKPSATLEEMAQHFSVKPSSVHARLKALNITRKKKTFLYEERDEEIREKFVAQLEKLKSQPIVYIDEYGIKNNIKNEYGRALRGQRVLDNKKGKVTEKLNVIAGLLNNKIIAPLVYTYSTNTLVFNAWLEKCLIPVLPENCVIIMDNASFHKSNETKEIIESNGHQLLFLPAYSPDLNPIEQYWAIIKGKIKKVISDYTELYSCIEYVFQTM